MPLPYQTTALAEAQAFGAAAIAAAEGRGVWATVVVLDAGGDLVLALRMDRSWAGAFDLALAKANAARGFAAPSGAFTPLVQLGGPLFGVGGVAGGKYLTLPGGLPLIDRGAVFGAVGVSGGTPEQDEAIAQAGIAATVL